MANPSILTEMVGTHAVGVRTPGPDGLPGIFQSEAAEVLGEVHRAFSAMLGTLGIRRPVELQKRLGLDAKLSWQICKVAADAGGLLTGPSIPSLSYVSRFIDAAAVAGVPAAQVRQLSVAYDRFEELVRRHAGDRTSFNSLVTFAAGPTDDWYTTDLQHRRNMFRGESHVMGVHARSRVMAALFDRTDDGVFQFIFVGGYTDLRVLRAIDGVRIHGSRFERADDAQPLLPRQHRPLRAGSPDSFLLEALSTRPLPPVRIDRGQHGDTRWVQTSLVRPEVGNLGMSTMMFGEYHLLTSPPGSGVTTLITLPVEVVVMDLFLVPGVFDGPPRLSVFRGGDSNTDRSPDLVPLPGDYKLQSLGRGTSLIATPDVPCYPGLIRAAALDLRHDVETFDVWRVRAEFPVYQSSIRLELPRPMRGVVATV